MEVIGSASLVRRSALMSEADAIEIARSLFVREAGGPHATGLPTIAKFPTVEEIENVQKAVLEVIGEKGSDKREHANALTARGMIDLEEALACVLADRFNGELPADEQSARSLAKRAVERLPKKPNKDRWKEARRKARRAAEKAGADAEAAAAAGMEAWSAARSEFYSVEIDVGFARLQETPEPDPDPEPNPEPEPGPPDSPPLCARATDLLRMLASRDGTRAVKAAWVLEAASRGRFGTGETIGFATQEDLKESSQLKYRQAFQRLAKEYPHLFEEEGGGRRTRTA